MNAIFAQNSQKSHTGMGSHRKKLGILPSWRSVRRLATRRAWHDPESVISLEPDCKQHRNSALEAINAKAQEMNATVRIRVLRIFFFHCPGGDAAKVNVRCASCVADLDNSG